jgi:thiol-disulfide isomerase/thioredoxin
MSGEDKSEGAGKSGEEGMKTGYIGILAVGLMIGIIIGIVVGAFGFPQTQSVSVANGLTADEAGEKVAAFISNYGGLPPGADVALINVTEVENANLYKIAVNISAMGMAQTAESYMTKDGKLLFPGGIDIEEFEAMVEQQKEQEENQTQEQESEQETTIGNFIVSTDEICEEDEKPIIYFFGSTGCPACELEHPVVANVTAKFEGFISFHDNVDSTADQEIFAKYSDGYIPTLVLGCKYYRVGSGASMGEDQEAKVLTALICDLTGNNPVDICIDPEIEEWINKI